MLVTGWLPWFSPRVSEEKLTSKQMIVRKEVDDVLGGAEALETGDLHPEGELIYEDR